MYQNCRNSRKDWDFRITNETKDKSRKGRERRGGGGPLTLPPRNSIFLPSFRYRRFRFSVNRYSKRIKGKILKGNRVEVPFSEDFSYIFIENGEILLNPKKRTECHSLNVTGPNVTVSCFRRHNYGEGTPVTVKFCNGRGY